MRYSDGGSSTGSSTSSSPVSSNGFTTFGLIVFIIILWVESQNATGQARGVINMLLFVLLISMILLNWSQYSSIFFKG